MLTVVKSLKRYVRLYAHLVKFAAMLETEYRWSFFIEIVVELAYAIVGLVTINVLFLNIREVAGWSFHQLLVLYGVNIIFSELFIGLTFVFNLWRLPQRIERGEIDITLAKPINSQFALTLWQPYFALIPSMVPGIVLIYLGLKLGDFSFNPAFILPALLLLICGLVTAYSIAVVITSLSFWVTKADALPRLASDLVNSFSNRPYSIFEGVWRVVFFLIFPVAFMTSFPAQTLLGDFNWWWLPAAIILAMVFLKFSNFFWNFALKRYTSAGG